MRGGSNKEEMVYLKWHFNELFFFKWTHSSEESGVLQWQEKWRNADKVVHYYFEHSEGLDFSVHLEEWDNVQMVYKLLKVKYSNERIKGRQWYLLTENAKEQLVSKL